MAQAFYRCRGATPRHPERSFCRYCRITARPSGAALRLLNRVSGEGGNAVREATQNKRPEDCCHRAFVKLGYGDEGGGLCPADAPAVAVFHAPFKA